MPGCRRANARRDENEPEIIEVLRDLGITVQPLSETGVPDLLWGWKGCMGLLEVKRPLGPRGGSKDRNLDEAQEKWWEKWQGPKPRIVRTPAEAIKAITEVIFGSADAPSYYQRRLSLLRELEIKIRDLASWCLLDGAGEMDGDPRMLLDMIGDLLPKLPETSIKLKP